MSPGRRGAVGMMLVGIASVQIGSAVATSLFGDVGPAGTVLLRTLFAALVLCALWRPSREALAGASVADIALFGVVLGGMNLCFYEALDRLPLGIAVTFEFTGPLAIAIWGSRRRLDLLWVGLAAVAIVLLAPGIGDGLDPLGVAFALAAGAFWAAYIVFSARVGRGRAGRAGLSLAMAISAALLIPFGLVGAGSELFGPEALAIGLTVALLSSALPYTLELEALKRLPEGTFGVLLSLEPAVAAVVGFAALDQELLAREVVAILIVVIASAGALSTGPPLEAPEA